MIVVTGDAELEPWSPDFSSSGQQNPRWLRLRVAGHVLSNALNAIDWSELPTQVVLCEQCGSSGCADGGYVRICQCGDFVVWRAPQPPTDGPWAAARYAASVAVRQLGAVAIPAARWETWRSLAELPGIADLPVMTGDDVLALWLGGVPAAYRCASADGVPGMLRRQLVACDTLDVETAIAEIERLIARLQARRDRPMPRCLRPAAETGWTLERLYLEGPQVAEWVAFAARGTARVPALAGDCIAVVDAA